MTLSRLSRSGDVIQHKNNRISNISQIIKNSSFLLVNETSGIYGSLLYNILWSGQPQITEIFKRVWIFICSFQRESLTKKQFWVHCFWPKTMEYEQVLYFSKASVQTFYFAVLSMWNQLLIDWFFSRPRCQFSIRHWVSLYLESRKIIVWRHCS